MSENVKATDVEQAVQQWLARHPETTPQAKTELESAVRNLPKS